MLITALKKAVETARRWYVMVAIWFFLAGLVLGVLGWFLTLASVGIVWQFGKDYVWLFIVFDAVIGIGAVLVATFLLECLASIDKPGDSMSFLLLMLVMTLAHSVSVIFYWLYGNTLTINIMLETCLAYLAYAVIAIIGCGFFSRNTNPHTIGNYDDL